MTKLKGKKEGIFWRFRGKAGEGEIIPINSSKLGHLPLGQIFADFFLTVYSPLICRFLYICTVHCSVYIDSAKTNSAKRSQSYSKFCESCGPANYSKYNCPPSFNQARNNQFSPHATTAIFLEKLLTNAGRFLDMMI